MDKSAYPPAAWNFLLALKSLSTLLGCIIGFTLGLVAALFVLVASMFQRAGDLMNE